MAFGSGFTSMFAPTLEMRNTALLTDQPNAIQVILSLLGSVLVYFGLALYGRKSWREY